MIAQQSLAFDAKGSLTDEGDIQSLHLELKRSDQVAGNILVDFLRNFETNLLNVTLEADEAPGGIVAELAGFPNDSASSVKLKAEGPLTDWALSLDAGVDNVITAKGDAKVSAIGRIAALTEFTITPGSKLGDTFGPEVAAAISPAATINFDMAEDENGVVQIKTGALEAADLSLTANGSFDRTNSIADLDVKLEARAGLAALVEGVDFNSFGFDGAVKGPLDDLAADGRIALDGLKTDAADVASADLNAKVLVKGEEISADVKGGAKGVRLDRLQPELLGDAVIAVNAVYDPKAVKLTTLSFTSTPLTLEASGAADLEGQSADLKYKLSAPRLGPLAAAYDQNAEGAFVAEGEVTGPFSLPRLNGSLALEGLRYNDEDYGQVRLSHDATFGETPEGTAKLRADGSRFGEVSFDGGFRLEGEQLTLRDMIATGLGATIEGALGVDLATTLMDGTVTIDAPDLSPFEAATGQPASGSVTGKVVLSPEAAKQNVTVDLDMAAVDVADVKIRTVKLDADVKDALGSPSAKATLKAADVSAMGYGITRLDLDGTGSDLTGEPTVDVTASFDNADLVQAKVKSGAFTAKGDIADMAVTAALKGVSGDDSIGNAQLAEASLDARLKDLTGELSAEGTLDASGIAGFGMKLAKLAVKGSGEKLITPVPVFDAEAVMTSADLGAAKIKTTKITAKGDLNDIIATLRAEQIAADGASVASASLDANVKEATGGDPAIDANLKVSSADLGAATLSDTSLTAKGKLSGLALRLLSNGALENGDPLKADVEVNADLAGAGPQATVSRLDFSAGEAAISLNAPLKIASSDGTTTFDNINIALPGGSLSGDAALHGGGLSGDLLLDAGDLGPISKIAELPLEKGALRITAKFDTRSGSAGAKVNMAASNLRFAKGIADIGALGLDADMNWNGREAVTDVALSGNFGDPFRVSATIPLRPSGGPVPVVPKNASLAGSVDWQGRIGDLWAMVPAPGNVLDGDARVALRLSGTLDDPKVGGDIALTNGQYQNLDTGTILVDLTVGTSVEPDGAFVVNLNAQDGSGGPVTARIAVNGDQLDAQVNATKATLVRRDDVTAMLSIDIAAKGPLVAPDISGKLNIDKAEVRLIAATPPGISDIGEVRFKGDPIPEEPEPVGGDIGLNIDITGPQDIFVRGRGLDSEWKINLEIRGTAADPRIKGTVEKRRGVLSFIGRDFTLDPGVIRFTGAPGIDPTLDIQLLRENDGIKGGIVVSGTGSAPVIEFKSKPDLPQEEVLPRVLFSASKQSLSPAEALSLASGIATLMDGAGGTTDSIRGAVGLDVLRVDEGANGPSVTVGSNVAEGVFVGAKQPIGQGSASVIVELEVLDNIAVDSEVGPDVGTSVGIKWKKDF